MSPFSEQLTAACCTGRERALPLMPASLLLATFDLSYDGCQLCSVFKVMKAGDFVAV